MQWQVVAEEDWWKVRKKWMDLLNIDTWQWSWTGRGYGSMERYSDSNNFQSSYLSFLCRIFSWSHLSCQDHRSPSAFWSYHMRPPVVEGSPVWTVRVPTWATAPRGCRHTGLGQGSGPGEAHPPGLGPLCRSWHLHSCVPLRATGPTGEHLFTF